MAEHEGQSPMNMNAVKKPAKIKGPTKDADEASTSNGKPSGSVDPQHKRKPVRAETSDMFQKKVLGILNTINTNQKAQDARIKDIETYMQDPGPDPEQAIEAEGYYEEEIDTPSGSFDLEANENIPPPPETKSSGLFKDFCTRYDIIEPTEGAVDGDLAMLVNTVFREGISEEKFLALIKSVVRPDNCSSLVKTKVNSLVWNRLSPHMMTADRKMQSIQEAMIKSSILVTQLLDNASSVLDSKQLELGTDALSLMGQANKLLNNRRKDMHKSDLNKEFHHLCTPNQKYTDMLYGDDVCKSVKDIQDMNKIAGRIRGGGSGGYPTYNRGRGRPYQRGGVSRGRVFKRGRGRGFRGFSGGPKNQNVEYSKNQY